MSKMHEEVVNVISDIVGNVDIGEKDYDTALSDVGVDSLDTFNILLELEEKYGVDFPEEEVESLNTVNLLVKFITDNHNQ